MKKSIWIALLLLFVAGTGLGLLMAVADLPPYRAMVRLKQQIRPAPLKISTLDSLQQSVDPAALIRIHSTYDVHLHRVDLMNFLWGADHRPEGSSQLFVERDISDPLFEDLRGHGLESIDGIRVDMDFDLDSVIYLFHPELPAGKMLIYHQGHRGGFELGKETIAAFLREGYAVAALAMPLLGMNHQPDVEIERLGKFHLQRHDQMALLQPESGNPVRYFLEPVLLLLDHVEDSDYEEISMLGISGGGWTTTLCAALDSRIRNSIAVAGSLPLYMREGGHRGDWGDYEQNEESLYRRSNYLELYVMAASGSGRRHIQILNVHDPCCFDGYRAESYRRAVEAAVERAGTGHYELILDEEQTEHAIPVEKVIEILSQTLAESP